LGGRRDLTIDPEEAYMITMRGMSDHILAEPFRPFRLTLAEGRVLDIHHPDAVQAGRSWMTVFTYDPEDPKDGRLAVSLRDVESVEPLDPAACGRGAQRGPITMEAIRSYKAARSFRPFYLHMAHGSRHEIRDPDLILIQKTRCSVLHDKVDALAILDLEDIIELGPIDGGAA
jgi:hypothetical protein